MAKSFWSILTLCIIMLGLHTDLSSGQIEDINDYLENIYKNRTLLKNIRPNFNGEPVKVLITMYNIDISSVSPESMDFKFDFYFRQKWNDTRLAFDKTTLGVDRINLNGAAIEHSIWRPDIFLPEAKSIDQHQYSTFSDGNSFYRISHNGTVFYSHRLTVQVSCSNHIKYFPMDKPTCELHFESYGYSTESIKFQWSNEVKHPVAGAETYSMIGFKVDHVQMLDESVTLSTGTYSRLVVKYNLKRNCGYYWINIYIPAALLVVMSWMSFCFDPEQRHYTRLAISIFTSVGILMLTVGSVGLTLPPYLSLTAIHVYLFCCVIMIFAAMIRASSTRCNNGCTKSYQVEQCQIINGQSSTNRCSRIIFPVVFIIFNICYGFTLWFATK